MFFGNKSPKKGKADEQLNKYLDKLRERAALTSLEDNPGAAGNFEVQSAPAQIEKQIKKLDKQIEQFEEKLEEFLDADLEKMGIQATLTHWPEATRNYGANQQEKSGPITLPTSLVPNVLRRVRLLDIMGEEAKEVNNNFLAAIPKTTTNPEVDFVKQNFIIERLEILAFTVMRGAITFEEYRLLKEEGMNSIPNLRKAVQEKDSKAITAALSGIVNIFVIWSPGTPQPPPLIQQIKTHLDNNVLCPKPKGNHPQ